MSSPVRSLVCMVAAAAACAAVQASPTVYFGENQTPDQTVSGDPLTARNAFLTNLVGGVGTETFESFSPGTAAPLSLTFPGSSTSIGATLSGTGQVFATPSSSGRWNTTGATAGPTPGQWWSAQGTFTLTFSTAISAFGFYGTDVGDFDGQLTITLTDVSGVDTLYTVNNTVNGADAALLFWGFVDTGKTYTKITFGNTSAGFDVFGFDDMTVGDAGQIAPPSVPEPSTIALLGACLLGASAARRRSA